MSEITLKFEAMIEMMDLPCFALPERNLEANKERQRERDFQY